MIRQKNSELPDVDKLLKSKPVIDKRVDDLKNKCSKLKDRGIVPNMKVILVGDNPASVIYTRNKKKFMERIGAECEIIKLPKDLDEWEFLKKVEEISTNDKVHGCFVQLPLPVQLSHIDVGELIPPHKDVDGFHSKNIYQMMHGDSGEKALLPCTPKGMITLMQEYGIDLNGKNVVMIGRSMIVGKPMAMLLLNHNATVTICHSRTKNLQEQTKNADIIISAIGKAKFLTQDFLRESKDQVIIDVGMNHDESGKLCGDVDFNGVQDHCAQITPVPGGVGPMTILSLAENLVTAASKS